MHYADVWEAVADAIGDQPAVIQGDREVSWSDYDVRAARVTACLADQGLDVDAKVGMLMFNCPEYAETQFGALKGRFSPINVNYRYLDDELRYLLDNADCEALVYHASLADRVDRVRADLPDLRVLIEVDDLDVGEAVLGTAFRYDDVMEGYDPAPRQARRDDDVYMLYTGGTTGMPKGVMYRLGSFTDTFLAFIALAVGLPPFESPTAVGAFVAGAAEAGMLQRTAPCCPLMHGTGVWLGLMLPHLSGSAAVLLEGSGFDADELWATTQQVGVTSAVIVGDAFGLPMVRSLRDAAERGEPWDVSTMATIISSGAMLSSEVKAGLLEFMPQVAINDILGSTEGGMAQSTTSGDASAETAKFEVMPGTRVVDDDDRDVEPGSGQVGRVAATGTNVPLGYYKDPEKSAATFREIDGVRYTFPGDMAVVEADGSITLLGRGSNCINTGGEKVFPEEVEEAVKTYGDVDDCLVFGVDDERFGQRVVAIASLAPGQSADPDTIITHVKEHLAHYKAPKQLVIVHDVPRAPNGKADYATARELFAAALD